MKLCSKDDRKDLYNKQDNMMKLCSNDDHNNYFIFINIGQNTSTRVDISNAETVE
jgi:hypothetical protein